MGSFSGSMYCSGSCCKRAEPPWSPFQGRGTKRMDAAPHPPSPVHPRPSLLVKERLSRRVSVTMGLSLSPAWDQGILWCPPSLGLANRKYLIDGYFLGISDGVSVEKITKSRPSQAPAPAGFHPSSQPVPPLSRRRGNLPADPVPPIPQKSAPPCRPSLPGPDRTLAVNFSPIAAKVHLVVGSLPSSSSRLLQHPSLSPSRTPWPSCQDSAPPPFPSPSTAQPTPELRQLHHRPPSPNPQRTLLGEAATQPLVYI